MLKLTITSPANSRRKRRRISVKRRLTPENVVRELRRVARKSLTEGPTYMRSRAWVIAFVDEKGNDRYSIRIEGTPEERKLVGDLFTFPFEDFDAASTKEKVQ